MKTLTWKSVLFNLVMVVALAWAANPAAAAEKPNILVIWGDDVGRSNISAYTMGMMGYEAPEISFHEISNTKGLELIEALRLELPKSNE